MYAIDGLYETYKFMQYLIHLLCNNCNQCNVMYVMYAIYKLEMLLTKICNCNVMLRVHHYMYCVCAFMYFHLVI